MLAAEAGGPAVGSALARWPRRWPGFVPKQLEQKQLEQKQLEQKQREQKQREQKQLKLNQLGQTS